MNTSIAPEYFRRKEEELRVKAGLSFVVLNLVNHLNDRLLPVGQRMDIEQAEKLSNEILDLLMNEHAQRAIMEYLFFLKAKDY